MVTSNIKITESKETKIKLTGNHAELRFKPKRGDIDSDSGESKRKLSMLNFYK